MNSPGLAKHAPIYNFLGRAPSAACNSSRERERSTMDELAQVNATADKVLVF
jgi:hypothetical protein